MIKDCLIQSVLGCFTSNFRCILLDPVRRRKVIPARSGFRLVDKMHRNGEKLTGRAQQWRDLKSSKSSSSAEHEELRKGSPWTAGGKTGVEASASSDSSIPGWFTHEKKGYSQRKWATHPEIPSDALIWRSYAASRVISCWLPNVHFAHSSDLEQNGMARSQL